MARLTGAPAPFAVTVTGRSEWLFLPVPDATHKKALRWEGLWAPRDDQTSSIKKSALAAPQSGQVQLSGTSSQRVPAGMPS